jgi:hypothetical protein
VDPQSDPQFCGNCVTACGPGGRCAGGSCQTDACAPGLVRCGGECVSLGTDPQHCGSCGSGCGLLILGNTRCQASQCKSSCPGGTTQCSEGLNLFACANLSSHAAHCGACGNKCAPGQRCIGGKCESFLYASGCWECGNGNDFPVCCTMGANVVCLPNGVACTS